MKCQNSNVSAHMHNKKISKMKLTTMLYSPPTMNDSNSENSGQPAKLKSMKQYLP